MDVLVGTFKRHPILVLLGLTLALMTFLATVAVLINEII